MDAYKKSSNNGTDFIFLDEFIKKIEGIIGKDINIDNKNNYVQYNTYTIDHDYNGNLMDKLIIISEKDNKIIPKTNHPFFKKDIVYYTNYDKKIDIYYDATSFQLLGYKEQGGEYTYSRYQNRYIRVNYSVINKLKYMGYSSKHIYIENKVNDYKLYVSDNQQIAKNIINDICRERVDNLKKVIGDIQRIVYKLKYKYEEKNDLTVEKESTYVDIVEKYKSKITKLETRDIKNKQKIFKNWELIKYGLFYKETKTGIININIDGNYLSVNDINMYDMNGNIILFYIINELIKLIDYNDNKFIKTNIIYMIIDMINEEHNIFNIDKRTSNFDIKRFGYFLTSQSYMYDVDTKGHGLEGETEGFYEEQIDTSMQSEKDIKDKKKANEEAKEESNAIDIDTEIEVPDVDTEIDYEVDYLSGVNVDVNQNPNIEEYEYDHDY